MTRRAHLMALLLATAPLLAAQPPANWLRRGNTAYERGDFAAAVEAYARTETLASDPGGVAFNRAAALYQLEDYSAAELDYVRALEDATGARRVKGLYGLGNALAQQGARLHGRAAVAKLLAAQRAYRACLAEEPMLEEACRDACAETFADARFNLQLLDPLLARKRAEAAKDPPPPPGGNEDPPEGGGPERGNRGAEPGRDPPGGGAGTPPDRRTGDPRTSAAGSDRPRGTEKPSPGRGNLPLLSEERGGPPLDAEAAHAALLAHLERIRRERSRRQGLPPVTAQQVRDW